MTAALATLSIDLIAKVATLQQNLDQATRMHEKHAAQVEARWAKLKATTASVAGVFGGTAVVSQITAFVDQTATAAVSIERLAKLSGTSSDTFQRMAYGAKTAGIEQDKLAGILKDVQDKVGDFLQTGAGPMADFFEKIAPRVGVTAKQFRNLGGAEALQLYVNSLQKANISQNEMTFYMEAIASDSALLLPLLRDNGTEFRRLGDEAARAGKVMSDEGIKAAKEYRANIDRLSASVQGFGQSIALAALPTLNEMIDRLSGVNAIGKDGSFMAGIMVPFEALTVLGANVVYVFKQIAVEAGAIAAQGAALARGDFAGFKEIREAVVRDAAAARQEIDKRSEQLLGRRAGADAVFPAGVYDARDARARPATANAPLSRLPDTGKGKAPIRGEPIQSAFAGKLQESLSRERLTEFGWVIPTEEAMGKFNGQMERLNSLIQATPSAQLETLRSDMQLLAEAYEQGRLGAVGSTEAIEKFSEAVKARMGEIPQEVQPVLDGMTVFFEEFQRNIQDSLGTTIKATLKGDFDSISKLWGNMLLDMAAQAIAADVGEYLFPKGKGVGGSILGTIASLFGFAKGGAFLNGAPVPVKAFASGTVVGAPTYFPMRGGSMGLMGEAGPEAIMPLKRGKDGRLGIASSGGAQPVTYNTYNVQAGVTRNELVTALQLMQQQIEGRVGMMLRQKGVV
ncbi:MAG: hypothetical protein LW854_08605 [Rubrivivax sp.]|nr:hypothetical protein [Rubrivivax sp.]